MIRELTDAEREDLRETRWTQAEMREAARVAGQHDPECEAPVGYAHRCSWDDRYERELLRLLDGRMVRKLDPHDPDQLAAEENTWD